MADGNALRGLPPWDRLPYYASATEVNTVAGVATKQVALANVQRVAISFGVGTAGSVRLSTLAGAAAASAGFVMTGNFPLVTFDIDTFGPLVTSPWFLAPGSGSVTVWEVILNLWPGPDANGPGGLIQQVDDGRLQGRVIRPTNRGSPTAVYGNRWGKRQAQAPYGLPDFGNPGLP